MDSLSALLSRFDELAQPGPFNYQGCHHHDGGQPGPHVVIGSLVHGDEVGSLPSVVSLLEQLTDGSTEFSGRLTMFLGNPEASVAGKRFLDTDLNRAFVAEPPAGHEGDRARELKPLLDTADVFLDLHQTIVETDRPFYTFPFDGEGWKWARVIQGATTWVTRPQTETFSPGTCCADEYVRLSRKPGLTLELGQKGFWPEGQERADVAIARLLSAAAAAGVGNQEFEQMVQAQPDLQFVQTAWSQRFELPEMRLLPGLTNFQPVQEGEVLSAPDTPAIVAPMDGLLLFPKYPPLDKDGNIVGPRPNEIVRIVKPMDAHPSELWTS